ncbi:MAG: hypothetical protein NTX53_02135 [candidate division WOR-3 bacterium]|nr:hypothetical protein [candidate division WOR-3 bacterium]
MSSTRQIACPYCKKPLRWEPERAGQAASCPSCKGFFTMPLAERNPSRHKITEEGPTEEAAKLKLKARIPPDAYVLSESATGKRTWHVRAVGPDLQTALSRAQPLVPPNATVLGQNTIEHLAKDVLRVSADGEQGACEKVAWGLVEQLKAEGVKVSVRAKSEHADLSTPSVDVWGTPGLDKMAGDLEVAIRHRPGLFSPKRYEAVVQYAIVQIDYETPAEAHVEYGDEVDYYLYQKDWEKLVKIGTRAAPYLVEALEASPTLTYDILGALRSIDGHLFEAYAHKIMRDGGSTGKDARLWLNRGRSDEEQYVTCPVCDTYLGVRKELLRAGHRITSKERAAAAVKNIDVIGRGTSVCPKCGADVIVG